MSSLTNQRKLLRGESLQAHLHAKASEFLAPEFKTVDAAKPTAATDPISAAVDAIAATQAGTRKPRNVEDSVRNAFRETAETTRQAEDLSQLSDDELNARAEALNAEADRREQASWEAQWGSLDEPLAEAEETDDVDLDPEMIALHDADPSE